MFVILLGSFKVIKVYVCIGVILFELYNCLFIFREDNKNEEMLNEVLVIIRYLIKVLLGVYNFFFRSVFILRNIKLGWLEIIVLVVSVEVNI